MTKIAYICELAGTEREGGEQKAMLRTAKLIRQLGNKVDVFSYIGRKGKNKISTPIPLKLLMMPFIRDIFFLPFVGMNLLKKLENNYDSINASSTTLASFYKPIKSRLVFTTHNIRSKKVNVMKKIPKYKILFNPIVENLIKFLEILSFKNADAIITITKEQRIYLIDKFKISKSKINLIPNGIDVNFFKPLKVKKENQVIFVGRGTIPKGIDTLLLAAKDIKAKILIVTKKIDKQYLDLAKSQSNVKVVFDPIPSELIKLYSQSKVFVLPSLDEEQPLTTLEAMSCGLPVVVTKVASVNDEKKIDGVDIVPPKSGNKLAKSINRYLHMKHDRLVNIGKINRKFVKDNFDLNKVVGKTISVLK